MEPITNPPTPYLGPISNGFRTGKLIRIQGLAAPQAERIDINLVTGETKDNIGLHLSARLLEGYVARNSFEGGIWGEEQDKGELPIRPGQSFEVVIFADAAEYKIAINGGHFCEFPYRIPIGNITHVAIEGDVSLSLISFEDVPQHAQVRAPQSAPVQQEPPPMAPQNFGPPQGGPGSFGPPGYAPQGPQGPYGPPPGQFGPGPYGPPPPPPGHDQKGESGLDSFLDSAQTVIQGAIASGMAEKLLSSFTSGGNNQQKAQPQTQQYQQQQPPQQSQGGPDIMGSLGTLLNTLTTPPKAPQQPPPAQTQPDVLGSLGSLLGSLTTGSQNQQQQPPQQQYQQPPPQQQYQQPAPQQDLLGGLGNLLSSFSHSQTQQAPQQQQPLQPSNIGGQGSVGGLGSVGSLLTTLAGQALQPQPRRDGQ